MRQNVLECSKENTFASQQSTHIIRADVIVELLQRFEKEAPL